MAIDNHTVEQLDGSNFVRQDLTKIGMQTGVVNASGATNATVTVTISIPGLPANYAPIVNMGQAGSWFVASGSKTNSQFIVSLVPPSGGAIAAGTIDVIVFA